MNLKAETLFQFFLDFFFRMKTKKTDAAYRKGSYIRSGSVIKLCHARQENRGFV